MKEPLRILLADDHTLFRQGIRVGLDSRDDMEIVGEAADGLEAIALARETMPDVILMDISMPRYSGLEATRRIKREMPYVKIIILTVSDQEEDLFEAIRSGADGYMLKNLEARELFETLQIVARGNVLLSGAVAGKILKEFRQRPAPESRLAEVVDPLSERELEVLELVVAGMTNSEIAERLVISEATVKNHLKNILEKLHLRNRTEAAVYALRSGLIEESL
ncbi:MAG: DNA-binding response regulator [Planctomycetaceae bacterium]|nr:MAG: DNA-binding response regulator [Planctomycetaceae bacterium]